MSEGQFYYKIEIDKVSADTDIEYALMMEMAYIKDLRLRFMNNDDSWLYNATIAVAKKYNVTYEEAVYIHKTIGDR